MNNGITLIDHDPSWSDEFNKIKHVIESHLQSFVLSIEHIGSTSIKGLSAKPILDIDLVISETNLFPQVCTKLRNLGYYHEGDLGIEGREVFGRENLHVPKDGSHSIWMDHHLYVCTEDSKELKRHLAFRNYLRQNTEAAYAYEELKKRLVRNSKDRATYTSGKSKFVETILKEIL
ncbi:GrpB family protein [Halobacillus salinarum]|uniref:GrpB family protein n=1 Tax=Halobacillus salinarum TaxID=2932257 RepID=A0ABY4EMJ8_9BACI|nr:GrpB family protein [Halobacillus salinarum]UOQ44879.1 GrpB family protein [Halobacillus salinarum]